jgi:hypothetical protein
MVTAKRCEPEKLALCCHFERKRLSFCTSSRDEQKFGSPGASNRASLRTATATRSSRLKQPVREDNDMIRDDRDNMLCMSESGCLVAPVPSRVLYDYSQEAAEEMPCKPVERMLSFGFLLLLTYSKQRCTLLSSLRLATVISAL